VDHWRFTVTVDLPRAELTWVFAELQRAIEDRGGKLHQPIRLGDNAYVLPARGGAS
jgi:hypothetical protein